MWCWSCYCFGDGRNQKSLQGISQETDAGWRKKRNREETDEVKGGKTQEETSYILSISHQWKCTDGASSSSSNHSSFFLAQRPLTPSSSHKVKAKILHLEIKAQAHGARAYVLYTHILSVPDELILLLLPHTCWLRPLYHLYTRYSTKRVHPNHILPFSNHFKTQLILSPSGKLTQLTSSKGPLPAFNTSIFTEKFLPLFFNSSNGY